MEYEDDIKVIINSTQVTILRKIRGNFQESFTGKSGENVDSNSEEFLVTYSKKFLITRSEAFLETHSEEFLITPAKEFLAIILLINSPKNPLHGDQVLRNSQEFPEKYSGEILRNFVGENSKEFFRNLSKPSLKTVIPQKPLILGISDESVTGNDSREISWKNL